MKYLPLTMSIVVSAALAYISTINEWAWAMAASWVLFVCFTWVSAIVALATEKGSSKP
jgi:hypothetical protein